MSIYELDCRIRAIEAMFGDEVETVDPATGEIIDLYAMLDSLKLDRQTMMENMVRAIRNDAALCDAIAAEVRALQGRMKKIEARIEARKAYMASLQTEDDGEVKPFECAIGKVSFPMNPPKVNITDESAVPSAYCIVKEVESIDKRAIRAAIESGEDVPGAELLRERGFKLTPSRGERV